MNTNRLERTIRISRLSRVTNFVVLGSLITIFTFCLQPGMAKANTSSAINKYLWIDKTAFDFKDSVNMSNDVQLKKVLQKVYSNYDWGTLSKVGNPTTSDPKGIADLQYFHRISSLLSQPTLVVKANSGIYDVAEEGGLMPLKEIHGIPYAETWENPWFSDAASLNINGFPDFRLIDFTNLKNPPVAPNSNAPILDETATALVNSSHEVYLVSTKSNLLYPILTSDDGCITTDWFGRELYIPSLHEFALNGSFNHLTFKGNALKCKITAHFFFWGTKYKAQVIGQFWVYNGLALVHQQQQAMNNPNDPNATVTITCVNGNSSTTITSQGLKPVCPPGYTQRK